eukprot:g375.t1
MNEFAQDRGSTVSAPPAPPGSEQKVLYEGTRDDGVFLSTQVCVTTRAIEIDVSGADPTMSVLTLGCWYMFFTNDYVERYPLSRISSLQLLRPDGGGTIIKGVVEGRRRGCCPLCPCASMRAETCCGRTRSFYVRIAAIGSAEDTEHMFAQLEAARKQARARAPALAAAARARGRARAQREDEFDSETDFSGTDAGTDYDSADNDSDDDDDVAAVKPLIAT